MTKPWQKNIWKKKRTEFIKDKCCEWCGSTEKLTIDHKTNFYPNYERGKIALDLLYDYFKDGKNQSEKEELEKKSSRGVTLYTFDACPTCGYAVSLRKTMNPKYKCYKCNIEFDEPRKKIKQSTLSFLKKRFFQEFCKKHSEEIESILNPIKEKKDKEYLEFKDVMILCHRCNFARLKGMRLCPVCKEHYVKGSFKQCFTCYSKTDEYKKNEEREFELEKEEFENDLWETQIQYCGNCSNQIVSNYEIFCGLSPDQICENGFFEGDGVRRQISKGTNSK